MSTQPPAAFTVDPLQPDVLTTDASACTPRLTAELECAFESIIQSIRGGIDTTVKDRARAILLTPSSEMTLLIDAMNQLVASQQQLHEVRTRRTWWLRLTRNSKSAAERRAAKAAVKANEQMVEQRVWHMLMKAVHGARVEAWQAAQLIARARKEEADRLARVAAKIAHEAEQKAAAERMAQAETERAANVLRQAR
jgi:hypothetical protein